MTKALFIVLLLASVLRLVSLDTHIGALYGDEISISYNAWSILHTGRDEFSKFLPIQFESWGDQKNPVYIYLVSIFQVIFGLTAWSVRLPSAISGIIAVALTYFLVKKLLELTNFQSDKKNTIALISSTILAINPWHIHISRGGYETNLALTLGLSTVYLILLWIQKAKTKYLMISLPFAVLAMYTYYTTKMFLPLLIITTLIWGYTIKQKLKTKNYIKSSLIYLSIFLLTCLPIIYLALFSQGQARFASINIFSNPKVSERVIETRSLFQGSPLLSSLLVNKPYIWVRDFFEYYLDNLSPLFWYVTGDSSLRYDIGNHGMFYLVEFPFFILGALFLFQKNKKLFLLLIAWLLLAPVPTALVGKSYGLRSLAILPIPMIFSAFGIFHIKVYLKSNNLKTIFNSILIIIFTLATLNWLLRYIYLYPSYAYNWYDGMQKDAVEFALREGGKYDNVVISRYYGKTEMYFAYYTKMNPQDYQQLSLQKTTFATTEMVKFGKYYFGEIDQNSLKSVPENTLVIAQPLVPFGQDVLKAREDSRPMFKVTTK